MDVIDFRVRPPVGGFLQSLMYADPERRDGITRQAGFEPSAAARQQSMALMLEEMAAAGVARAVVVGRHAGAVGTISNDDIADLVRAHPGRFLGVASIDPTQRVAACETITRAWADGFKAVTIEPGWYPLPMHADDRRLYPIYAHCEDLGVPLVLTAGGPAGPDLSYSDPMRTDRVLADFPRLTVVLAHGGWPWVHPVLAMAQRRANLYLCPDMYFCGFAGWEAYVQAADGALADRMLYASAFPFCPIDQYRRWFERLPLRPDNLRKVMGENARRLLRLS